jgi:hypothetical protein
MNETKFTPGPWEYKQTSGYDYGSTTYWLPGICTNVDKEANAHLIAAAPDLYAACEQLLMDEDSISERTDLVSTCESLEKIKAALAKARGEL